ncbi:hypothetical protein Tco_1563271 [Tanacetum coccineum]
MAEIGFFIDILLGFPGPSDGLRLHPTVFFSSGSGLTADSSVLTLTLAFLDFGLDFAQSFPFHAQFCLEELFTEMPSNDDATGAESPPRGVDSYYRPGNFKDSSPIVYPTVANGAVSNFEIQPNLIAILPVFRGREEPYAHMREFFSIADTYQVNNTTKDGVRLRLFPFSLKDQAKAWFTSLEPGSINSWSEMQSAFVDEFYSIS